MRQRMAVTSAVLASLLWAGVAPVLAAPLACDSVTPAECLITTLHTLAAGGALEVDRALHIGATGEIRTAPGTALSIAIAGGLTMDVGARITGNAASGKSSGASLAITAAGPVLLSGNGTAGALISADQVGGSCSGGTAGSVSLTSTFQSAAASITTESGSAITANARCSAGAIAITATKAGVDIRGRVESASTLGGVGAKQPPGGGPITISASCNLTINDTGRVSSRGGDPGADLVHLEAGGHVLVIGVVESTGAGHTVPNSPKNHCSSPGRPDKPANSVACVEIWAAKTLVIDATGTNHGDVNADTAQSGGHQMAWIDVFANGNIAINGAGAGPYGSVGRGFAVHANEAVGNSDGGIITVKSVSGKVALSGQAIQADGGLGSSSVNPTAGGAGGVVVIEAGGTAAAGGDVNLGAASVRARGANSGGGAQAGGDIAVRSFNAHVVGTAPGEVNAAGGGGQATPDPGTVTLKGCNAAPPAVSYGGTATPAATIAAPSCGGNPSLPAYVIFPTSSCDGPVPCQGSDCPPCQPPNCPFVSFCEKGSVKEVLDPNTGRFLSNLGPDVIVDLRTGSLQAAIDGATDSNGDGYVIVGVIAQDNGVPGGSAVQGLTIDKTYARPFALIGCGVTLIDPQRCDGIPGARVAASATSPEHPAGSGVTLFIQEITVQGSESSPAWLVEGQGRFLEAVGAHDNMAGIKVVGDGNTLHGVVVSNNFTGGLVVEGKLNTLDGVRARLNTGTGIKVTGDNNQLRGNFAGGQGSGNMDTGIAVAGKGNLLDGNKAMANGGDGINVSGGSAASPNVLKANVAGATNVGNEGIGIVLGGTGNGSGNPIELDGNTAQGNAAGGIKVTGSGHQLRNNVSGGFLNLDNTGCNYSVAAGNINATGNKAKYFVVPGANGSAFPTACIHF